MVLTSISQFAKSVQHSTVHIVNSLGMYPDNRVRPCCRWLSWQWYECIADKGCPCWCCYIFLSLCYLLYTFQTTRFGRSIICCPVFLCCLPVGQLLSNHVQSVPYVVPTLQPSFVSFHIIVRGTSPVFAGSREPFSTFFSFFFFSMYFFHLLLLGVHAHLFRTRSFGG